MNFVIRKNDEDNDGKSKKQKKMNDHESRIEISETNIAEIQPSMSDKVMYH